MGKVSVFFMNEDIKPEYVTRNEARRCRALNYTTQMLSIATLNFYDVVSKSVLREHNNPHLTIKAVPVDIHLPTGRCARRMTLAKGTTPTRPTEQRTTVPWRMSRAWRAGVAQRY